MTEQVGVVVIGGGVAGFAAAISARKSGKSVMLLEKNKSLGGNAIQSNVGTICGAYYRSTNDQPKQIEHPILSKLVGDLKLKPLKLKEGLVVLPYQVKELHGWMETELKTTGVKVLCSVELQSFVFDEKRVSAIVFNSGGITKHVYANSFIDASGNGVISELLALEMISSKEYQAASQVFRVSGADILNEFSSNFAIQKELSKQISAQLFPKELQGLSIIPGSVENGIVDLKFVIPVKITDETNQEKLDEIGLRWSEKLMFFLKENVQSFKHANLQMVFPQAGIRVRKRSKGISVLTKENVLGATKTNASAARGTWPIEIWKDNGRVEMHYFEENEYYDIPMDCLKSLFIENLFFAGKNISATNAAIASARVIGTCLQTGYSAGILASELNEN